jgi:hypothetical protein
MRKRTNDNYCICFVLFVPPSCPLCYPFLRLESERFAK